MKRQPTFAVEQRSSSLGQAPSAAAPPARTAPPVPVTFGFNEWPDPRNYQAQSRLNAPIRRMLAGWNQVQPAPDTWDWRLLDEHYESLVAAGLRPLVVAVAAPCWAHPRDPCEAVPTGWHPPDREHEDDWAEFVRRLAARYPAAAAIEVWNEPNLLPSFLPALDPVRYTQLLRSAYRAVKSEHASMPVISGGLFASPVSGYYGIADDAFVAAMYAAGAKGFMDGIGVHPYPVAGGWDGTTVRYEIAAFEQTLARIRTARDRTGDAATPLWVTEMGVSTQTQDGAPVAATETQQADALVATVRALSSAPDIPVAVIHRLIDRPVEFGGPFAALESGFGLFRSDGTPKRAACALSAELGGTLDCG